MLKAIFGPIIMLVIALVIMDAINISWNNFGDAWFVWIIYFSGVYYFEFDEDDVMRSELVKFLVRKFRDME